ncbi:MAG: MgtC/SapB family protein [Bacteroidales bacterium]|nr:MgtC/SapB family protein [Bacteroidales bacterium]
MTLALELSIRLVGAGLLGAFIGYERELRAKGAGIRTHVLVAMGSALFMLISQYGFDEAIKFDAARVAAGVVGGLGFLGGGIIMKTKNHVSGLTTAAGIWVTGAIGLAMGSGMFLLSILCTVVMLVCLEALNYYTVHLGDKEYSAVLWSADQAALMAAVNALDAKVRDISLAREGDGFQASLVLRFKKRIRLNDILKQLSTQPNVNLESLE